MVMTTWCSNCSGWVDENHVVVHSDRSRKPPERTPDEKASMEEARRLLDAMEKTGMGLIAGVLRTVLSAQEAVIEDVRALATAQQQSASRSTRFLADSILSALVGEP